ncbi:hypothetical protein PROFUN_02470 [Planoprotostelium fungivorum]|uniref:Uncharacterized protein n=1 Tax=Planoprotostelium fungivorum TaxID=1890364 RepID=A0A2P6MP37_9EUKA|nr:hypothetical protein PROFUN_02470 [Planoprotostelium fungivorum]
MRAMPEVQNHQRGRGGVVYGHHIRTKQFNESLFIKNDFKPKKAKEFLFNEFFQFVSDVKCWAQQRDFPTAETFPANTQASTSPSSNMPSKAYETPADLAQAAKDYGGDTQSKQLSYITQTGSAGQKAWQSRD